MIEQQIQVYPGDVGLDYASWRPTMAQLHALGVTYVSRYICRSTLINKWIFRPEVDQLHAAGIGVMLNWEQGAGDWVGGAAVGRSHGLQAVAYARDRLSAPQGIIICFSLDTNVAAGDHRALDYCTAAFAEVYAAGYRFGVYGDLDVIRMVREFSDCNWLAGATSWSDPTKPYEPQKQPDYDLVHVRQYIAGSTSSYDRNVALRPFDVWLPHEVPEEPNASVPIPPVTSQEIFMPITATPSFYRAKGFNEVVCVGAGPIVWCSSEMIGTAPVTVVNPDPGQRIHPSMERLYGLAGITAATPSPGGQ